ncbi:unnamed protein product [Closterium sp. NIES-65]|nr:unnamed protein product [Closterium sp. NIES-65]
MENPENVLHLDHAADVEVGDAKGLESQASAGAGRSVMFGVKEGDEKDGDDFSKGKEATEASGDGVSEGRSPCELDEGQGIGMGGSAYAYDHSTALSGSLSIDLSKEMKGEHSSEIVGEQGGAQNPSEGSPPPVDKRLQSGFDGLMQAIESLATMSVSRSPGAKPWASSNRETDKGATSHRLPAASPEHTEEFAHRAGVLSLQQQAAWLWGSAQHMAARGTRPSSASSDGDSQARGSGVEHDRTSGRASDRVSGLSGIQVPEAARI